jgi:hypothetical protein
MSELEKAFLDWWKEESGWDNPAEHGDVLLSEGQLAKAAFKAGAAWNQRQPHPDSVMLDWLEENTPEIWFNDNGCVLNNLGTGEGILHNSLREAIQQAMEQEK